MGRGIGTRGAQRFREPMQVCQLARYSSSGVFPVCPQCKSIMEREYQRYCDRCGQRLGWKEIGAAQIVDIK